MWGFTRDELRVVLFLVFSLLVGVGVRLKDHLGGERDSSAMIVDTTFVERFESRVAEVNAGVLPGHPGASQVEAGSSGVSTGAKSPESGALLRVDINRATASELERLPQVGPVLSRKIVEYRESHGRFNHIRELVKVKGIGAATFKRLEPHLEPIE